MDLNPVLEEDWFCSMLCLIYYNQLEMKHVFNSYRISVNTRHLSFTADFYDLFRRVPTSEPNWGDISIHISHLSKMSFEAASQFIVEAAMQGEVDILEAPSARVSWIACENGYWIF